MVFKVSKSRIYAVLFTALAGCLVIGNILYQFSDSLTDKAKISCYVLIGFFVLPLFICFHWLRMEEEILRLTEGGIEDRRMKIGPIPWNDIEYIKIRYSVSLRGQYLELNLTNPEKYRNKIDSNSNLIKMLKRLTKFSEFQITFGQLTPCIEEAIKYIKEIHPEKLN